MTIRSRFARIQFAVAVVALCLVGCKSARKTMPHMGVGSVQLEGNLTRDDLVVMQAVDGTSSTTSILFGLIQIVDGSGLKLFGISFFTDKYTYFGDPGIFGRLFQGVGPEDRAYYKALEKTPDADIVLVKSMDRDEWGFPILFSTCEVTFRGKAMQLKADQ